MATSDEIYTNDNALHSVCSGHLPLALSPACARPRTPVMIFTRYDTRSHEVDAFIGYTFEHMRSTYLQI